MKRNQLPGEAHRGSVSLPLPAILAWATRTKAAFAEMVVRSGWVLSRRSSRTTTWEYPGVSIDFADSGDAADVSIKSTVPQTCLVYLACWDRGVDGVPELKAGAFGAVTPDGRATCRFSTASVTPSEFSVVMVVGFDGPLSQRLLDKAAEGIASVTAVGEIDAWLTWLDSASRLRLIPREFAHRNVDVLVRRRALRQLASAIDRRSAQSNDIRFISFLDSAGAIEHVPAVRLANGLSVSVSIHASKLCDSEASLAAAAEFVDQATYWLDFDTIMATGWQMATIARRLIASKPYNLNGAIEVIEVEGNPPICLRSIRARAKVLVLTDVIVTGSVIARVRDLIHGAGAKVIDVLALVGSSDSIPRLAPKYRSLCQIELGARLATSDSEGVSDFNSVSHVRTLRKILPRTVSEFLSQFPAARELWTFVDAANAFEKHCVEGDVHYLGFVNVEQLLSHPTIGDFLLEKLVAEVRMRCGLPTVLLVPDRERSIFVAERLRHRFGVDSAVPMRLVIATESHGRFEIHASDKSSLEDAYVLVVDSAMSHGATVDDLVLCAGAAGAHRVGVAVLLSRLSESHEEALRRRLDGHLAWLYSVPIRPIVIREDQRGLCPVCRDADELKRAAITTGAAALVELDHIRRSKRRGKQKQWRAQPQRDLVDKELLEFCKPSTALGVLLHAEHTAQNNGMAPLSVRDVTAAKFAAATKAAMVSAIGSGLLRPSESLLEELRSEVDLLPLNQAWVAACECLGRSGDLSWLSSLESRIGAGEDASYLRKRHPWRRIAFAVFRAISVQRERATECATVLRRMKSQTDDAAVREGTELVLATLKRIESQSSVEDRHFTGRRSE